jgi:hypothetical protein
MPLNDLIKRGVQLKTGMRVLAGLLGIMGTAVVFAAQEIVVKLSEPEKGQHLTVQPEVLRAVCAQAVEREDTKTRRTVVSEVWPTAYSDTTVSCVVGGNLIEGSGLRDGPGYLTVSSVRYRVQVDLLTQKADIVRVDEAGAKQVALAALADKLITMKTTSVTSRSTTYSADVAGKKCTVEVGEESADGGPATWVAKPVKCH